ncbi:hypothetical protein SARC_17935, partial [Sphaeroforma arctica JP610]
MHQSFLQKPLNFLDVTYLSVSSLPLHTGVNIHNNCKLLDLDVREHEVEVRLGMLNEDGSTTPREPFTVSSVLFSVGRTPCTDTLNLDGAGVKLLPKAQWRPTDTCRASQHHISTQR